LDDYKEIYKLRLWNVLFLWEGNWDKI
jgi:hypothetical protein